MSDSPVDVLTAELPSGRRRQWVLWGALLTAVAVLGGMAWQLFRAPSVPSDTST